VTCGVTKQILGKTYGSRSCINEQAIGKVVPPMIFLAFNLYSSHNVVRMFIFRGV